VGNKEKILEYLDKQIENIVNFHTQGQEYQWNVEEIAESVKALSGLELHSELVEIAKTGSSEKVGEYLKTQISKLYEAKEKELNAENMCPERSREGTQRASASYGMRQLEKLVLLRTIDELWMDHIDAMEYMRDSVRLRAYGQRDPLVEYKTEGHKMFQQLTGAIEAEVANLIFKVGFFNQPRQVKTEEGRPNIISGEENMIEQESRLNLDQQR